MKRPLTVSVRTPEGKELKSGTVEEVLSNNLPPANDETSSDNVAQVVVPVSVAVEVADASN